MVASEQEIIRRLANIVSSLLNGKDKLGATNLPSEFAGYTSELLYNEGVAYPGMVLIVDAIVQQFEGKSDEEMITQFELLRNALTTLYNNIEAQRVQEGRD